MHFDFDGDLFAERSGWLGADDGFLAIDRNANGAIDGIGELFGNAATPGFAALAALDGNGDGRIDAADAAFAQLRIWRDLDQDGVSDSGELFTPGELGIASFGTAGEALGSTTLQGAQLPARGFFTRTDGATGRAFEAIFPTDPVDTLYRGEAGKAAWLGGPRD